MFIVLVLLLRDGYRLDVGSGPRTFSLGGEPPTVSPGVPSLPVSTSGVWARPPPQRSLYRRGGPRRPPSRSGGAERQGGGRRVWEETVTGCHTTIQHFEHFFGCTHFGLNLYVRYMYPSLSLKSIDFNAFFLINFFRKACNSSESTDKHAHSNAFRQHGP